MRFLRFLIIASLLIIVHEFGHFFAAKTFGVQPKAFAFGFGTTLYEYAAASGTTWKLNVLPLGGYNVLEETDWLRLTYLQNMVFTLAGVAVCFLCWLFFRWFQHHALIRWHISFFWYEVLGMAKDISFALSAYNLIPVQGLDGGKALEFTLAALWGEKFASRAMDWIFYVLVGLFIICLAFGLFGVCVKLWRNRSSNPRAVAHRFIKAGLNAEI